jgi:hypothetical protein
MTHPFKTVVPQEQMQTDRVYIPMARTRGKLLIVRPLEYAQGYKTQHSPDGTDVVFADIAVLDPIPDWQDEYGMDHAGFQAGQQFRRQSILQGYLKGTFKRYIGDTLIGTIYFGPKEKGKPPMHWQDLSGDPQCVMRGQQFLAAHPEFLVPEQMPITTVAAQPATGPQPYTNPAPAQQQQQPQQQQPPLYVPEPYQQPAQRPVSTLDQLRQAMPVNHHGQPQATDAPF